MALLSIIVPVYNVSQYLREGLDSILNQEVKDIEVICVDDASTDKSLEILEEFAAEDERVTIMRHSKNGGLSAARNTGLRHSTGSYVAFFDPDDSVDVKMYSRMLSVMSVNDLDISICGYRTTPSGHEYHPVFCPNMVSTPGLLIKDCTKLHTDNEFCFTWRFMFRRQFLADNDFEFNEKLRIGEDAVFNMECFMRANKIYVIPDALYNYRTDNQGSLMRTKHKPHLDEILQLQIQEKSRIIRQYKMDDVAPITKDMSADIIKRYIPMMLKNYRNAPDHPDMKACIKHVLNMPMVRNAMSVVGFRNIYPSWKEYMFYLAMKFRIMAIVGRM